MKQPAEKTPLETLMELRDAYLAAPRERQACIDLALDIQISRAAWSVWESGLAALENQRREWTAERQAYRNAGRQAPQDGVL